MRRPSVYLAGPITGLTYAGCVDWRKEAIGFLDDHGIDGLSPMRGKEYLQSLPVMGRHGHDAMVLSRPRGITTRDRFDCTRSDMVLAHLAGATQVSIGTVMELAWADAHRVPLVATMEEDGSNPHDHGMVNEVIGWKVTTLEEALEVCVAVLVAGRRSI